jgi:hypothetical protein
MVFAQVNDQTELILQEGSYENRFQNSSSYGSLFLAEFAGSGCRSGGLCQLREG